MEGPGCGRVMKGMAVQAWALDMAWPQDSSLLFTSCVTLDKLLSKSHFIFIYKMTIVLIPISEGYREEKNYIFVINVHITMPGAG